MVLNDVAHREQAKTRRYRYDSERLKIAQRFINDGFLYHDFDGYGLGITYLDTVVEEYRGAIEEQEKIGGTGDIVGDTEKFNDHVQQKVFDGIKRLQSDHSEDVYTDRPYIRKK